MERISEMEHWPGDFGNWGRWDDYRGTMNLIDGDSVISAADLVHSGRVFACSAPLTPTPYPDELRDLHDPARTWCMTSSP